MKKISDKLQILGLLIVGIVISSIIATKAATTLSSSSVYYDTSKSGGSSSNVNGAIDELYSLTTDREKLKAEILDLTWPVGSVYISTTDSSVESVQERFGGTWLKYAEDMTLVGASSSKAVNTTGGSSTVTLSTSNLPSHSHVIPALTVSSWSGEHSHYVEDQYLNQYVSSLKGWNVANIGDQGTLGGYGIARASIVNKGEEHLGIPAFYTNGSTITVSGQTTTASNTTSCTNCSGLSFSIQNPYTAVYMYKRTA